MLAAADRVREAGAVAPLPVEMFSDVRANFEQRALIKGLLMASSALVMFGPPGCGKSFLAIDIGFHVGSGLEWFGRRTVQGGVVILAAEGQGGVRLRIEALRSTYPESDDVRMAIVPAALDLLNPNGDLPRVAAVLTYLARKWGGIALLIVDTLAASFGGGDENGSDMAAYFANVTALCQPYDCARIIVTHAPLIGDAKRPRGHGSLWGAADTVIQISGGRDDPARRLHVVKQKDGDPGSDILFKLRSVELGLDRDGDAVTSCVVEPSDLEPTAVRGKRRLTAKEQIVLASLERVLTSEGVPPPPNIPDNVLKRLRTGRVANVSEWRSSAVSALHTPDSQPDSARRTFGRARERLQASKIVGVWEEWAWFI